MSTYTPDRWKVLRFTSPKYGQIDKVLAGWKGGYMGADWWKLNSGNESMEEFEDRYEFKGYSGSTYVCFKHREGFTLLSETVFNRFKKEVTESTTIEVIDYGVL